MNTTHVTTYWTLGEASTVIDFLDTLRDTLWETYGEEITRMQREACGEFIRDTDQYEFEFDDDIPF
ncbi:MAG: hypothetical protein H6963_01395 [Chromatiaceae bacterium]|nr:hypothetical protein [Chromatiaceae bacterium]